MGYLHIDNLYKDKRILEFRECYALEKIHGTSAHISYNEGELHYFPGGAPYDKFVALFDHLKLLEGFKSLQYGKIVVFGEHYGGKIQRMSDRYGKDSKFVAFDVRVNNSWLDVERANSIIEELGLEFVSFIRIPTDLELLDRERDAPSTQAMRNGVVDNQPREGIVIRPVFEVTDSFGNRIIAKHKRPEERETRSIRNVIDADKQIVLTEAKAIADEYVTPMRLSHVLDKITVSGVQDTALVIKAMIEDVMREGDTEIVDSMAARKAIGSATAKLFKDHCISRLYADKVA